MVLYIRLLSNDAEDFVMEIAVNDNATFMELHTYIQKSLGYDSSNMASFVITDNDWNREKEISLMKMNEEDKDIELMEETTLKEFIKNKKQRLLYVFDFFSERAFFMEVFDIRKGEIREPELIKKEGTPPEQIAIDDSFTDDAFYSEDMGNEFDEGFEDLDSLDPDNIPDDY